MPLPALHKRLYSHEERVEIQSEWKEYSMLERLYIHLLAPAEWPITPKEAHYLENLRVAWTQINTFSRRILQVQMVAELCAVTERQASNIVNDAQELFGEIHHMNEEIDKDFLIARYLRLAEKAEDAGEYESAGRIYDSISKIKGFFHKEKEGIKKDEIQLPDVVISSDPAIIQSAEIEAEDAEISE